MSFFLLRFTTNFLNLIRVSFLELNNIVKTGSDLLVSKQEKFLVSLGSFTAFLFNPAQNSYRTIILVNGLKSCLINMGYYINNIFRSYYSILRSISIKKACEAAQYRFNSSIIKAKVNIQIKRYSCNNMLCLKISALIKNSRNILQLPSKKFLKFSRQLMDYQSVLLSATPVALLQQVAAMAQQGYSISAMHSQGIAYEAIYDGLDYACQNEFITEVVYCKLQDQFNNTVIVYTILIVVAIGAVGVGLYYLIKKWRPPEEPSEPSGPSTMPSLSSSPSGDSLSLGRGNGSQCVYVILLTLNMLISLKLFTYIECSQYQFIIPTFGKDIWATTFNKV
jgi:hypothetical protein